MTTQDAMRRTVGRVSFLLRRDHSDELPRTGTRKVQRREVVELLG